MSKYQMFKIVNVEKSKTSIFWLIVKAMFVVP